MTTKDLSTIDKEAGDCLSWAHRESVMLAVKFMETFLKVYKVEARSERQFMSRQENAEGAVDVTNERGPNFN